MPETFDVIRRPGRPNLLRFSCLACEAQCEIPSTPNGRRQAKIEMCIGCINKCAKDSPYHDAREEVFGPEMADNDDPAVRIAKQLGEW